MIVNTPRIKRVPAAPMGGGKFSSKLAVSSHSPCSLVIPTMIIASPLPVEQMVNVFLVAFERVGIGVDLKDS